MGGPALVEIDPATGSATPRPNPTGYASIEAMTYDPVGGRLLGVDRNTRALVSIDPVSGVGSLVTTLPVALSDVRGMAASPAGDLLAVDATRDRVTFLDPATGQPLP